MRRPYGPAGPAPRATGGTRSPRADEMLRRLIRSDETASKSGVLCGDREDWYEQMAKDEPKPIPTRAELIAKLKSEAAARKQEHKESQAPPPHVRIRRRTCHRRM